MGGQTITFVAIDESHMFKSSPPRPTGRRRIVAALSVPCPVCDAEPHERCQPNHRPFHSERARDAQAVQDAIEALSE